MKKFLILTLMVLTLLVPASVIADTPLTLILENKDSAWAIIPDGRSGSLSYHASGATFDFSFSAIGMESEVPYSLIYYANPYPGNNPGALIGTGTSDGSGTVVISGTPNVGNIPSVPDSNMVTPHNVAPDNYVHAYGAKVWLVPTDCYDGVGSVIVWSPTRFLFETDLITYTDTDAPGVPGITDPTGGVVVTTTVKEMPSSMGLTVSPYNIPFGEVYIGTCSTGSIITLHNAGTVPVKVTATTSTGFYTACLKLSDGITPVNGWVSATILPDTNYDLTVKICPTIAYSGTLTGSVSFVASYAP